MELLRPKVNLARELNSLLNSQSKKIQKTEKRKTPLQENKLWKSRMKTHQQLPYRWNLRTVQEMKSSYWSLRM